MNVACFRFRLFGRIVASEFPVEFVAAADVVESRDDVSDVSSWSGSVDDLSSLIDVDRELERVADLAIANNAA